MNLIFTIVEFDYPVLLFAFLIFIPVIFYDIYTITRKNKYRLPANLQKRLSLSVVFYRIFIALSIFALAGPRWGMGYTVSEYRRGLDTVFAIDVSRSMDIRDVQTDGTSRLEQGLLIAGESMAVVPGARFAAAVGRSRGYLAVPLTYNNEAASSFIETLDGSSMTGRSTNLESLVDAAANAFQSTSAARRVIVLISDGESHSGVLRNALNRCVSEGIIVTAVAVGSDEGAPVLQEDGSTPDVISRRDSTVMRMAAERTGGIYIDGNRVDAASVLSAHLLSISQETLPIAGSSENRQASKQRRTLFIILALIAYSAGKFIPRISKLPLASLLIVLFLSSCQDGRLLLVEANYLFSRGRYEEAITAYQKALNNKKAAPYAEYGLALALYSLDEGEIALERYGNSQKILETFQGDEHRELRYRNFYNSGIIHFEDGNFYLAADAFKEALRTDPRKPDAKRNLEISLMSIKMEASRENRTEERSETREVIFDYIKQQEQQRWISREWSPEEHYSGPDW